MNPRQRRGLLLIAIAALGLVAVFVLIAGYVADVREEVDPKVRLLELSKPAEALPVDHRRHGPRGRDAGAVGAPVGAARSRRAGRRRRGGAADEELAAAEGHARRAAAARPGQRELAILVDAETGVAGKIGPDSVVDIVATYPGNDREAAESRVVVPNARIVEVGTPRVEGGRGVREQNVDPSQVVPVTFALTPEQVLVVSYAESNASEVRLALLRPGDDSTLSGDQRAYSREPDPEPAQ